MKRVCREWPLFFVFAAIVFMVYPMLGAAFGVIDDHEIARILGRDHEVRLSEIFPLIQQWAIEHDGRFRPGYYVLRIIEASVAGGDARLWYANRLVLAFVSASALYVALRIVLRPFYAGVVTLLLFSGPQNEVWTRLGPQESYGVPLVLISLAFIVFRIQRRQSRPVQLFPALALLMLCGFVKESFIPILPATVGFLYLIVPLLFPALMPRGVKRWDAAVLGVFLAGTAIQLWLLLQMIHTYGNQKTVVLSLDSLLSTGRAALVMYSITTLWFVPVAAGLASLLPRSPEDWSDGVWWRQLRQAVVLLTAAGVFFLVPQLIVYAGTTLMGRYLTPGNLFVVFAAAFGFYLLSKPSIGRSHAALRVLVTAVVIAIALYRAVGTHRDANEVANASREFQHQLGAIAQLKAVHPDFPLLFYSTDVFDREPLVSVASFLEVTLPTIDRPFLNTFDWEKDADSLLKVRLARLMRAESVEGDPYFARIADFHGDAGHCIAVVFSQSIQNVKCDYAVHIPS